MIEPNEDVEVLVSAKYLKGLEEAADTLAKLEAAGVDNWEWYSEALYGDDT